MKVFNLSYDQSTKLQKGNNPLEKKELLQLLIADDVIDLSTGFSITDSFGNVTLKPLVVNPVKTTFVFHSKKNREDILPSLNKLSDRMFFVLTEVQMDENLYLGTLYGDDKLQEECSNHIKEIMQNM